MRSDSTALGVITGLLMPLLGFLAYATLYVMVIRPHMTLGYFVSDVFLGTQRYQAPILSLSLIANLALFFWFDRQDMPQAMRGVITASFIHGAAIIVLWL